MTKYTITIEVTDPDVSEKTLRWLLSEAGEVVKVEEEVIKVEEED